MDRHQVRLALLKIICLVLIASTWVFSSFVLATRPEEQASSDPISNLVRLPASLPAQIPGISALPGRNLHGVFSPQSRVIEPIAMDIVKLPCWDKVEEAAHDTSARWIRLTGRACQGSSGEISVRNLTNGYTATVFSTQAKNMTTDFIPLESGKNEIMISFETTPGARLENQVFFIRE